MEWMDHLACRGVLSSQSICRWKFNPAGPGKFERCILKSEGTVSFSLSLSDCLVLFRVVDVERDGATEGGGGRRSSLPDDNDKVVSLARDGNDIAGKGRADPMHTGPCLIQTDSRSLSTPQARPTKDIKKKRTRDPACSRIRQVSPSQSHEAHISIRLPVG